MTGLNIPPHTVHNSPRQSVSSIFRGLLGIHTNMAATVPANVSKALALRHRLPMLTEWRSRLSGEVT